MKCFVKARGVLRNNYPNKMKILLSGVETSNKGAELMLYAILQEIERKMPDAVVYLSPNRIKQGVQYIKTNVDFRVWPYEKFVAKFKLRRLFHLFHLPYCLLPSTYVLRNIDYHLDGSGFAFSDQFRISDSGIYSEKGLLSYLSKQGCKNIFLPQAFGPVEKPLTKKILATISEYASIIMPREKVSYKYLKESGIVDMKKVKLYTDFTSLVDGVFPSKYENLREGICIIPNSQMINKGAIPMESYLDLLKEIVSCAVKTDRKVYMLNHAGWQDKELCNTIKQLIPDNIEMVTDLNALEIKGLISSAYLVITSRFHGLASALNSCVPALSTSWSHKYEELYHDYALDSYVFPLDDSVKAIEEIKKLLDADENNRIREHLKNQVPFVKKQTREMWDIIWNLKTK